MGPAIKNPGEIISFLGAKGGVGTSILTALFARFTSKNHPGKVAVVDGGSQELSLLPSYLSIKPPFRSLSQLEPYHGHLTQAVVGNFFASSNDGITYIPLLRNEEKPTTLSHLQEILEQLTRWFDFLLLDLSSFPADEKLTFLESSHRACLVTTPEPSSLAALRNWEKFLLSHHFPLKSLGLILNRHPQTNSTPPDLSSWAPYLTNAGMLPFCEEELVLALFESRPIPQAFQKALEPLVKKIITSKEFVLPNSARQIYDISTRQDRENLQTLQETQPGVFFPEESHQLHQRLLERLRQSGILTDGKINAESGQKQAEQKARIILDELIQESAVEGKNARQTLSAETLNLAFGFGPLETLLKDPVVTEIMVNGPNRIYVEKAGKIEKTNLRFFDEQQLRTIMERILAPLGRRIDESQPYVDGRLPDGSRVNAIISPLSLEGPILTIRKFSQKRLTVEDLIQLGSITREAADLLGACVGARKNIVVSGGTGSGKTTLLNILSNFISERERIVTIEDSAELRLNQEHVVRLETRPANLDGSGRVAIRDLVINALRMRPDRIVVGEVRGGEALDMLQAMNTGHDGSLTTVHANSPRDALSRLETMALFSGLELPLRAVREQIARAVHLVVQQSRLSNGKRAVTRITEVQGMEGDVVIVQDLFTWEEDAGLVRRPFAPSFITALNAVGYEWPIKSAISPQTSADN